MYGQLVQLQKKLGKENFPLIEQTFYPSSGEMVRNRIHYESVAINKKCQCISVGGHAATGGSQSRACPRRGGKNKDRKQLRFPGYDVNRVRCLNVLYH